MKCFASDLLNKNNHLIFFSQHICLILKVKLRKKKKLQNFPPKLVVKVLCRAGLAQTWVVCCFSSLLTRG